MKVYVLVKIDEFAGDDKSIVGVFETQLDAEHMQVSFKDDMVNYSIKIQEVIQ